METQKPLEQMTVKELRRFAIDSGFGITYLSERDKDEILKIIKEEMKPRPVQPKGVNNG